MGWIPKPEKAQPRLDEDGVRNLQGPIHVDERHNVWDDVVGEDVGVACAGGHGGLDEGSLLQGEHLRPYDPCDGRPSGDPNHHDEVFEPWAEDGGQHDDEGQAGQDQHDIRRPHEDFVDGSPKVAGGDAHEEADDEGDEGGGEPDDEGGLGPIHDLAPEVPAELVGSKEPKHLVII